MNKNNKHKLIPKLRFPEFQNAGEWEVKKLGEVLEKNKEKNKDRKYTLVQSVSNKFGFINQDEYFENRIVASKDTSNYYVIRKGCFAYNPSRIDVGSLAYKNDENISIISPLYVSFKAKNDKVLDLYLLNWFRSNSFIEQMIFEGGVRNTLNFDNLIEISIPLPSLPEQQKIASCLSSLDEVITGEQQKLELLKQHKKGLLQNLFPQEGETVPKLRFPEFKNAGEWEVKKLGEVAEIIKGEQLNRNDLNEKSIYPCLNGGVNPSGYTDKFNSEGNTITISEGGNSCGYVNFIRTKFWLGGHCYKIKEKEFIDKMFLFQLLKSVESKLMKLRVGSGLPNIQLRSLKDFKLIVSPSLPEQQKIAACLSSLDDLITAQTQKIEQLQRHKKGLLQGLFPNMNEQHG
jgi:type I restriction enzyme S subunit